MENHVEHFGADDEGVRHRHVSHNVDVPPLLVADCELHKPRSASIEMSNLISKPELHSDNDPRRHSVGRVIEPSEKWPESDLESVATSSNDLCRQRQLLDLKRPDSVITTSSIMSSSDSQAGDGLDPCTAVPPSVYAISGLYGPVLSNHNHRHHRHHSEANHESWIKTHQQAAPLAVGRRPSEDPQHQQFLPSAVTTFQHVNTHRRQTSYPVTFQSSEVPVSTSKPIHHTTVARHASNPVGQVQTQQQMAAVMVSNHVKTHKRSYSHGYHRNPPMFQHGHRRTGSSVIDTLQTLACNGVTEQELSPQESLVQFLENLRKEQQEKCERQELHQMQDQLEDLRDCGLLACRPLVIQKLANIKVFVFLLSILVTIQQALSSGYLNSVITTIEKRYEIPSSISGIIASMYEVGNVFTVIFVSYLGSRRHIPVWIGLGVLVIGIGSITFSLPHFLTASQHNITLMAEHRNNSLNNICKAGKLGPKLSVGEDILKSFPGLEKIKSLTEGLSSPPLTPHNNQINRENNCIEQASESSALPIFIFMIAQLLLGCGGSPLFTLGTTYIDNHVKRDSSSVYIGFMYSMCAFGPVCGFLLGAFLLSKHVDTFSHDVSTLTPDNPQWIGMWWGGFLICGASLLVISLPFFFFPKELKKEKVKVYIDEKYHHATDPSIRPTKTKGHKNPLGHPNGSAPASKASTLVRNVPEPEPEEDPGKNYGKDIKDIPRSTWKLLTNKIYMVTCLGACMELIIVSGFIIFLPKYLETQFNLSKSMASMFTGGIAIPGACIGIILGGYIIKRLQLKPKGACQLVIICNLVCFSCYVLLFIFGCDNVQMAGTTLPYFHRNNQSDLPFKINLTASCNFGCECDMNDVQPVCGANGLTYFSPCHAGCSQASSTGNYSDCACVLNNTGPLSHFQSDLHSRPLIAGVHNDKILENPDEYVTIVPVATSGACNPQCQMIFPFMILLFFMTLFVAVTQMPVLMLVLRAVDEEEKAFALGIQFVIFRLFGYIPSPILFGNVIDSTCILWKSTCAGEAGGRCLLYDIEKFRYKYVGVCAAIKFMSMLLFIVDWILIRNRQRLEKKEMTMTVGEVVNSIISLDKLFDPDGPLHLPEVDPENGAYNESDDLSDGFLEHESEELEVAEVH